MSRHLLLFTLLIAGCPEPPPSYQGPGEGGGKQGPGGAVAGGGPPEGAGQPGAAGAAPQKPEGFQVEEGEGIKITGTLAYAGSEEGSFRIDFLKISEDSPMPVAVHSLEVEELGAWEVQAPTKAGEFTLCAFLDLNEDGPSPGEPKVILEKALNVDEADITGIDLTILDNWDETNQPDPGDRPAIEEGGPGAPPVDGAVPVEEAGEPEAEGGAPAEEGGEPAPEEGDPAAEEGAPAAEEASSE